MVVDLAESIPFTTKKQQTLQSFSVDLKISSEILLLINPHLEELQDIIPGVPVNLPPEAFRNILAKQKVDLTSDQIAPVDWAVREFEKGVQEYPGPHESNPEIEKYHAATDGVQPDDIAWCSSFVNWCVRQSGMEGTNNKAARSWHRWGSRTDTPKRGDIAVFKRKDSTWKGHVGFYWEDGGDSVGVLGGNQDNMVRISSYPKNGTKYALLSIRTI